MNRKHQNICTIFAGLALACTLISQPAAAQTLPGGLEMSFIANQAHGDLLQREKYFRATQVLNHASGDNPFAARTNLCVAKAMVGQFREAQYTCNKAVDLAEDEFARAPRG